MGLEEPGSELAQWIEQQVAKGRWPAHGETKGARLGGGGGGRRSWAGAVEGRRRGRERRWSWEAAG